MGHDLKYRADIDGLRSIAIIPVVLYHAGVSPVSGGFVGVDVFFVISGYLITSLITTEIDSQSFSLQVFYWRRAKRILPALLVMMGFCAVVGWLILMPQDYRRLGESLVATSVFLSNVLFWFQFGYFDAAAVEKPLLHTWSLAIEEQFYLLYPLYLVFISGFSRYARIAVTATLALTSLLLDIWVIHSNPSTAFFLSPFRAWELLLGALLAMDIAPALPPSKRNPVAVVGVGCIAAAVFGYSKETLFPGLAALLPTIGAVMIIWSGTAGKTLVSAVLSSRPFVFVGKVSYSWYLWHFCLLAFANYLSIGGIDTKQAVITIVGSFAIAVLSWHFVEQPFRRMKVPTHLRAVALPAAITAMFVGVGLFITYEKGVPSRFPPDGQKILAGATDFNPDRERCLRGDIEAIRRGELCKLNAIEDDAPQFALWGDSQAEVIRGGIERAASLQRKPGVFIGADGCAPLIGIERPDMSSCRRVNDEIMNWIRSTPSVTSVILAGRWAIWAEGWRYKQEDRRPAFVRVFSSSHHETAEPNNRAAFEEGLKATLAALHQAGKTVWLIGPTPEIGYDVPKSLYLDTLRLSRPLDIRPTYQEFGERQMFVVSKFDEIERTFGVKTVWPHRALCREDRCDVQRNGIPLYSDDNHLTNFGAGLLTTTFAPIFE
jgi:peptidoglycan/LPS O-acetylase OafA/YrhL